MSRHILWAAYGAAAGVVTSAAAGGGPITLTVVGIVGGAGMVLYTERVPPALPAPHEEPLDTCDHEVNGVPVEVTIDDEVEVVGWLCSECGAKLSSGEATRRNAKQVRLAAQALRETNRQTLGDRDGLKAALATVLDEMHGLVETWHPTDGSPSDFIISEADHAEYTALIHEASLLRDSLKEFDDSRETTKRVYAGLDQSKTEEP